MSIDGSTSELVYFRSRLVVVTQVFIGLVFTAIFADLLVFHRLWDMSPMATPFKVAAWIFWPMAAVIAVAGIRDLMTPRVMMSVNLQGLSINPPDINLREFMIPWAAIVSMEAVEKEGMENEIEHWVVLTLDEDLWSAPSWFLNPSRFEFQIDGLHRRHGEVWKQIHAFWRRQRIQA